MQEILQQTEKDLGVSLSTREGWTAITDYLRKDPRFSGVQMPTYNDVLQKIVLDSYQGVGRQGPNQNFMRRYSRVTNSIRKQKGGSGGTKGMSFGMRFLAAAALLLSGALNPRASSSQVTYGPSSGSFAPGTPSTFWPTPVNYASPTSGAFNFSRGLTYTSLPIEGAGFPLVSSPLTRPTLALTTDYWNSDDQAIYEEAIATKPIGKGDDGAIYHTEGSPYAVKVVNNKDMGKTEAYYLNLFNEHIPGVFPAFHGATEINGNPVIIMDYIEGITAKQALNTGIVVPGAKKLFEDLVTRVHQLGVAHRDLYAGNNIVLTPTNDPAHPYRAYFVDAGRVGPATPDAVTRDMAAASRLGALLEIPSSARGGRRRTRRRLRPRSYK